MPPPRRLLVITLALGPVLAPAVNGGAADVVLGVAVFYDASFANRHADPAAAVEARIAAVNSLLAAPRVRLLVTSTTPLDETRPLCAGSDSLLEFLANRGSAPGNMALGISSASRNPPVLGCAYQSSLGTTRAAAAVHDPPYEGGPLAASEETEEHHAIVLYAHEIGHVLGGLHALAWPQGQVAGATGTIMYPTVQFNLLQYSGVPSEQGCIVPGNVCRIHEAAWAGRASTERPHVTTDLRPG